MLEEGCNVVFSNGNHVMFALQVGQNRIGVCVHGSPEYMAAFIKVIKLVI